MKENKKAAAAQTAPVAVDENNVMDLINKQNLADTSLGDEILAEIQKEKDDKKKEEMKTRFLKADFGVKKSLLSLRNTRRLEEISRYEITQAGRLARLLIGFTVTEETLRYAKAHKDDILEKETFNEKDQTITIDKTTYKLGDKVPGIVDVVDYDKGVDKLRETLRKKRNEADSIFDDELNKLRTAYGNYYDYSWSRCW